MYVIKQMFCQTGVSQSIVDDIVSYVQRLSLILKKKVIILMLHTPFTPCRSLS